MPQRAFARVGIARLRPVKTGTADTKRATGRLDPTRRPTDRVFLDAQTGPRTRDHDPRVRRQGDIMR
jgi:hypothetical protein